VEGARGYPGTGATEAKLRGIARKRSFARPIALFVLDSGSSLGLAALARDDGSAPPHNPLLQIFHADADRHLR